MQRWAHNSYFLVRKSQARKSLSHFIIANLHIFYMRQSANSKSEIFFAIEIKKDETHLLKKSYRFYAFQAKTHLKFGRRFVLLFIEYKVKVD